MEKMKLAIPYHQEEKTANMAMQHDTLARNMRARLKQVFDASES